MKIWLPLLLLIIVSCSQKDVDNAQKIIDEAIETHGGKLYEDLKIGFQFRKYTYQISRLNGIFNYSRTYADTTGTYQEALTNDGVTRSLNGSSVEMDQKTYDRVMESINSQVYFALLPFGLNDAAVNKAYLGTKTVEGQPYHKIKVTFEEEGGGVDFEDVFIYWIHQDNHTVDYLAYEFHVNKGGFRFRKAYNVREVGGILWADYINYKESDASTPLEDYDLLLEQGKLIELSRIELEDVQDLSK